jgi:threonine dehydrogenase-like Zn-dependent dehydrogenase
MVRRGGDVLVLGLHTGVSEVNLLQFTLREIDLHGTLAHVCAEDIPEALEILSTSNVASQVLDRVISLDELVPQGMMPLVERTAKGKIVVDLLQQERDEHV